MGNGSVDRARRRPADERGHRRDATASSTPRTRSRSTSSRSGSCPSGPASRRATSRRRFPEAERRGALRLVASRDGASGSVTVHQDVRALAGLFEKGESASHRLARGRHAWVQVARGRVLANGQALGPGDAAAVSGEPDVRVEGVDGGEVLALDLA